MDILIKRFLLLYRSGMNETEVNAQMKRAGDLMGFVVKVEQFRRVAAPTIRDALQTFHFQFIGYYFHTTNEKFVYPFMDLARTMSQMAYPSGKWNADRENFKSTEVMRLTSIAMGSGIAPASLDVQTALFQECQILLIKEMGRLNHDARLDRIDERLRWATQVAPQAMDESEIVEFSASIRGLSRAFDEGRGVFRLWRHPEDTGPKPKIVHTVSELLAFRPRADVEDELPNTSELVMASALIDPEAIFRGELPFQQADGPIRETFGLAAMQRADLLETAFTSIESPLPQDIRKETLGRMPRNKRETRAAQFKRVGRLHKLNAEQRRQNELLADSQGLTGTVDLNDRRAARALKGKANAAGGSRAARVSAEDVEAKDLRRAGGSGKSGGRRRKKKN
jgi:hypothetical protein